MTVADHKGSQQLTPWIQKLYDRYKKRIDIHGVADVSMALKAFAAWSARPSTSAPIP